MREVPPVCVLAVVDELREAADPESAAHGVPVGFMRGTGEEVVKGQERSFAALARVLADLPAFGYPASLQHLGGYPGPAVEEAPQL